MNLRPGQDKRSSLPALNMSTPANATARLNQLNQQESRHRSYYGFPAPPPPDSGGPQPLSFDSPWPLYGGDWALTEYGHFLAVNTLNEEANNRVHILSARPEMAYSSPYSGGGPEYSLSGFTNIADALVSLPQTKVAWDPMGMVAGANGGASLKLMSTGDCLRLWNLNLGSGKLEALCPLVKRSKSSSTGAAAPLTSFDWCSVDNTMAITSSVDTTCTLWDLAAQTVRAQLIAHDSDVYDVSFLSQSPHKFVSVGADGSARLFDLRALDNSTIIFELSTGDPTKPPPPLLRVATSPSDANVLACIALDSPYIYVIDIRSPQNPVQVLDGHQAPVNSIRWAPSHVGHNLLVSGGDDSQMLLWDVSSAEQSPLRGCYTDSTQISSVMWCPSGGYLAAVGGKSVKGIRY